MLGLGGCTLDVGGWMLGFGGEGAVFVEVDGGAEGLGVGSLDGGADSTRGAWAGLLGGCAPPGLLAYLRSGPLNLEPVSRGAE